MTLPGAPFLARGGAELRLEGHALAAWRGARHAAVRLFAARDARGAGRPTSTRLRGRPHLVCYAMKANSSLAVLQTFAQAGCGFDIVSGGELARVLAAGGDPARVVFSGVGKTRAEMRQALEVGVRCFNVESLGELDRLDEVALALGRARAGQPARQPRRRRRHAPLHLHRPEGQQVRHRRTTRRWRPTAMRHRCPGSQVVGIDCHIGSQITEIEPYLDALDRLLDLVEAVEAAGIRIHHLDVGGGLGITYTDEQPPRGRRTGGAAAAAHSTRAATATASCCSSPVVRWSAMPACC